MTSISRGRSTSGKVEQLGEERRAKVLDPCLAVVVEREVPLICRPEGGDPQPLQQLPRRAGLVKRLDTPIRLLRVSTSPPRSTPRRRSSRRPLPSPRIPRARTVFVGRPKEPAPTSSRTPGEEGPSAISSSSVHDRRSLSTAIRCQERQPPPVAPEPPGQSTDPPAIRPWQNPPVVLSGQELGHLHPMSSRSPLVSRPVPYVDGPVVPSGLISWNNKLADQGEAVSRPCWRCGKSASGKG